MTPRQIIEKPVVRRKYQKQPEEKRINYLQSNQDEINSRLFVRNMKAKRQWNNTFNMLKEAVERKTCQSAIPNPAKIFCINEGNIKTVLEK